MIKKLFFYINELCISIPKQYGIKFFYYVVTIYNYFIKKWMYSGTAANNKGTMIENNAPNNLIFGVQLG